METGFEHVARLQHRLAGLDHALIERWGGKLADVLGRGGRLLAAGNGGSAAEAQHLTAELVGKLREDRRPFSAIALHVDSSSVTAIGNDYGFEEVFARQVHAHGRSGDVLLLLSTSGGSENILRAARAARAVGLLVWGMTGPTPNPLADLCDEVLCVPDASTATVQECHLVAVHLVCAEVDVVLGVSARTVPDETQPAPIGVVGHALLDRDFRAGIRQLSPEAPLPVIDDVVALTARVRALGGTVVATGGCFDLIHAGHIAMLAQARRLGDCLVVCVNDDESVRRLKGETRPVMPERDRALVLASLSWVDAVVLFGEDTPEAILKVILPDIWVKGGDYRAEDVVEAETVAVWGGRTVIVPYVEGRSTTGTIARIHGGFL